MEEIKTEGEKYSTSRGLEVIWKIGKGRKLYDNNKYLMSEWGVKQIQIWEEIKAVFIEKNLLKVFSKTKISQDWVRIIILDYRGNQ